MNAALTKDIETKIPVETEEVATKDTKAETVKVDALNETTVDKTTAMAETGIVQNVRILILHSEQNAIAVEMPVVAAAAAVEDPLNEMTEEVATKDTKAETVKVDALNETTVDKTTAMAEIGIVQNVEILTLHSEPSVINVDFLEAAEMTDVVETTAVVEMTDVVEMEKSTPITIGIVQNARTQISHSVKNATDAKHLAQVAAAAAAAADDLLDETTALMPLDAMTVEGLLDETTALMPLDAMTVDDLLDETTVEATKAVAHTDKTEHLNGLQENLEPSVNHVEMALAMHITALQSRSAPLSKMEDLLNEKSALMPLDEMMTVQDLLHAKKVQDLLDEMVETEDLIIEGAKPWVRKITILTP